MLTLILGDRRVPSRASTGKESPYKVEQSRLTRTAPYRLSLALQMTGNDNSGSSVIGVGNGCEWTVIAVEELQ
jgi:hypothetical protein